MTTATPAPALHASLNWLNADPQTIAMQRGRVTALVFWNASSAYCSNLIEELLRIKLRHPVGLAILGIHQPKFDVEIDGRTVHKALNRLGVNFPVANDRGWVAWQHYGIVSWPSVALIDSKGFLREIFSGDDQVAALDLALGALIEEAGADIRQSPSLRLSGGEPISPLLFPSGLLVTESHLYVADTGHHRILECTHEGRVLREFGTGYPDLVDGAPTEAAFRYPRGLCMMRDYLYVADTGNHAVRRIHLIDGQVHTVAGTGKAGIPREGVSTIASDCPLNQPTAVTGINDRLFIAMTGSNQIWEFDLGKSRLCFIAGTGELGITDGQGRNALLAQPMGMALVQQTLYVADSASSAVRAIQLQQNSVQTLVGQGLYEFGEQDGQRRDARLQYPQAVALDPGSPVLWVADTYNGSLRKLRLGGGEMSSHPLPQPLYQPSALAMLGNTLWIADAAAHEIMRHDIATGLLSRIPVGE
ncbi:redoxin domain-containing protein [Arenimonas oryziterrae]|uniref:Thioredoxin domain-containing protein n=1 Tax=Arenimonas oryziterrae DSM 21050 = YC6267 TaxID=1121015 RepID=A0A091AUJ6_9GAMM|nr:redoxin domain-containing protein [Arenimonas oryziterrae]KFN42907.1 hypothetical protein N789_12320 [Arenimonas oryziterrae DSM 21050 = YC6267]